MSTHSGDTTIVRRPTLVAGGRAVAAERGWAWIAEGWEIFKKTPGLWIGMTVVYLVITVALIFLPIIGLIAVWVLFPVFAGGVLIACAKLDAGEEPLFTDLFAGFKNKFGALAAIGAIYVVASFAISFCTLLAAGVNIASIAHSSQTDPAALLPLLFALLVIFALTVPLLMAEWFAVPLVLFHDQGAIEAMKGSFSGCLRNVVPFLLYGVAGLVFGFLASIPLGLGWLVFGPVMAASVYTGYKDVYLSQ